MRSLTGINLQRQSVELAQVRRDRQRQEAHILDRIECLERAVAAIADRLDNLDGGPPDSPLAA